MLSQKFDTKNDDIIEMTFDDRNGETRITLISREGQFSQALLGAEEMGKFYSLMGTTWSESMKYRLREG